MQKEITEPNWTEVPEIEIAYKTQIKSSERPKITDSGDAYNILIKYWEEGKIELQEQCKVLFLNRSNGVLGICTLFTGGIHSAIIDPKLIFAAALKANAISIVIAVNHPSGNKQPSKIEMSTVNQLTKAGKILTINLHDFIIVTKDGYSSFNDLGYIEH